MKVLIATVTAGAGHVQAAGALEEAWRALRPGDEVHKLDAMAAAAKALGRAGAARKVCAVALEAARNVRLPAPKPGKRERLKSKLEKWLS